MGLKALKALLISWALANVFWPNPGYSTSSEITNMFVLLENRHPNSNQPVFVKEGLSPDERRSYLNAFTHAVRELTPDKYTTTTRRYLWALTEVPYRFGWSAGFYLPVDYFAIGREARFEYEMEVQRTVIVESMIKHFAELKNPRNQSTYVFYLKNLIAYSQLNHAVDQLLVTAEEAFRPQSEMNDRLIKNNIDPKEFALFSARLATEIITKEVSAGNTRFSGESTVEQLKKLSDSNNLFVSILAKNTFATIASKVAKN